MHSDPFDAPFPEHADNDDREIDEHERELIAGLGFDPDDPAQVHEFYDWERSLDTTTEHPTG